MDETVAAGTDNAGTGRVRPPARQGSATPRQRRNAWFLSPIEGSFHPYGLNALKPPEGATPGRLRSPNDEQYSGDLDPHGRRTPGAPGSA
ncbi:hypothetical protein GCM10010383_47020 [Streptomyces lomondensis]|uniref:Uncharacterized protein n=1 Tax=Streptomyces lomondensis TaxID=68229 RepID=A0ABQ2XDW5_9ACTN|nr:hypothetical protein GCM10010383_47020 [Streptomyces lomondensis]